MAEWRACPNLPDVETAATPSNGKLLPLLFDCHSSPAKLLTSSSARKAARHLDAHGIGISTPKTWAQIGYTAGDTKHNLHESKAFAEIFPFKDGEEHQVVSRMSAGGAFEMLIDGNSVATGRANNPDPLSLEIPEGVRFPSGGRGKLES